MKKTYYVLLAAFLLSLIPMSYASAQWKYKGHYDKGLAWVKDNYNKVGFIDRAGTLVIPCQWKRVKHFREDLAAVQDDNDLWGYIDKKGKVVIPCKWKGAGDFANSLAAVQDVSGLWGYIDKKGEVVIPCKRKGAGDFSDSLAAVQDDSGLWGYIDKTGKEAIPYNWTEAGGFSDGLALIKGANDKWNYIDKTGKVVIPCEWIEARSFLDGLALIKGANDKWGYIDKTGKVVIPCEWKEAWGFFEGLALIKGANDKWGYIDKTGKVVIPCEWDDAYDFNDGMAEVYDSNNKLHWIDRSGTDIIKKEREEKIKSGKSYYISNDDYMILLPNGDFILPCARVTETGLMSFEDIKGGNNPKYMIKDTPLYFDIYGLDITNIKEFAEGTQRTLSLDAESYAAFRLAEKGHTEANTPDGDINKLIRERVLPNLPKNVEIKFNRFHNLATIGTYKNGTYTAQEDVDKKAAAAEKRDIAAFKAKYGFDPSATPLGTVIRSGRSVAVFDAWNKWRKVHDYYIVNTELTYDGGNSKKYYFYFKGSRLGYFWIRNGKIESVSWY